jgi:hypothetical protein
MQTTLQQKKQNKIRHEMKRRKNTAMNLMKGNPELTAKSNEQINKMKIQQDLIIKGKRIKPYRFELTDKDAARNKIFRKVKEGLEKKRRERLSAIPGPAYPPAPQIAPYLFLPPKVGRTRKRQFTQQLIDHGGRRTRRKRRNRKRKTKKKRRRRRTKKKRRRRRRKTRK